MSSRWGVLGGLASLGGLGCLLWAFVAAKDPAPTTRTQPDLLFAQPAGESLRIDLHLPAQVRHQLFLAAKEALNNAVKHSHATSVGLRLSLTNDCVEICVQDNGIGFDPAATQTQRNGLRNLCQRLESVGGSCGVTSNPGAGTSVRLAVPLSAWACGGHHPCAT